MAKEINWSQEQLEEHRLELESRIRNLFWTVSGDYTQEIHPDIGKFKQSKYLAIYDAVLQGAFAATFDQKQLIEYLLRKRYLGADEKQLAEIVKLCIDASVHRKLEEERKGMDRIRREAFRTLNQKEPENPAEKIAAAFRKEHAETEAERLAVRQLEKLDGEISTGKLIEVIDRLYNENCDLHFEEKKGDLAQVMSLKSDVLVHALEQEFLTDEEMDHALEKYLKNLKMDILDLQIHEGSGKKRRDIDYKFKEATEDSAKRVRDYVELTYGKSMLSPAKMRQVNSQICRGIHRGCTLYYTKGILQAYKIKNNQYRYAELTHQKNRMYYYGNHRIIKRNIANLTDDLRKVIALREEKETWRDRTGVLIPSRLWKLNRTDDEKLFDKCKAQDNAQFVVDILLDGSGSQLKRQSQVAAQAFIISEALSNVGIPCRIISFSTFWDYTIMHVFRDYEDDQDANLRLFEYSPSATNRDGLAIKAMTHTLKQRPEDNKIMIILSDGNPNDPARNSRPDIRVQPYTGRAAVKDTAFEVRRARAEEIAVLGVFSGAEEDLDTEKKIFGKDFAYIRNISNFSKIVGNYLEEQLL